MSGNGNMSGPESPVGSATVEPDTRIELEFKPSVELIAIVRRFVSEFYDQLLRDPDVVSRVALATHELLENAVRHAADGETTLIIAIEPRDHSHALTIRMTNRASHRKRESLAAVFADMQSAEDPFEHYCRVMKKNARRSDGSGLGLARIRAEADMALQCAMSDETVTITATTPVALRGES